MNVVIEDKGDRKLDFGKALNVLKLGGKVARAGWNGKGIFIYLVNGRRVPREDLRNEADKHIQHEPGTVRVSGHIDMKAADGSITIGWNPSQIDMLAEDWEVVA